MSTKQQVLIGYPRAGESWNYTGHASEAISELHPATGGGAGGTFKQSGADTYALVAAGLRVGIAANCDITGAQGKQTQAKRARAVGVGDDPAVLRAGNLVAWLEQRASLEHLASESEVFAELFLPRRNGQTDATSVLITRADVELQAQRARLLADIASEEDIPRKLLVLAGGAGYGAGKHVTLQSGGMAARAARYVKRLRGASPSDTSLQDAAAAAVARLWLEWQCYSALVGDVWNEQTVLHLAGYAWRAAFASLIRDGSEGRTGRHGAEECTAPAAPLDQAVLELERASLDAWARDRQGRIFTDIDKEEVRKARAARRRALSWIASVLGVTARAVKLSNGAREHLRAERARFSVLARLVHGRDIATAARGAGYASGRAALESFRAGRVWPRLRDAVASHVGQRERALLAIRRRAARRAGAAIRLQRAAALGAGRVQVLPPVARRVTVASGAAARVPSSKPIKGAARIVHPAARRVVTARGIAGRGAVHPLAQQWRAAVTARAGAVALARDARRALLAARSERVALFNDATKGLRAGWMR